MKKIIFENVAPFFIRVIDGKFYKVYQRCGIDEFGYFLETEVVEW